MRPSIFGADDDDTLRVVHKGMATSMDIAGTRHSADEATTCTHPGFLHLVTWIDDNFPNVFVNAMWKTG